MKTYKRELAVLLLLWLVYIVETKDVEVLQVLVWPIFGYVAAAFGFDSWAKQLQQNSPSRGRTTSSSQRPSWQGEHSASSRIPDED